MVYNSGVCYSIFNFKEIFQSKVPIARLTGHSQSGHSQRTYTLNRRIVIQYNVIPSGSRGLFVG